MQNQEYFPGPIGNIQQLPVLSEPHGIRMLHALAAVAQPQAGWSISTFELVWERADWRIWRETITPGPAPDLNASVAAVSAAQLEQALLGFTPWRSGQ